MKKIEDITDIYNLALGQYNRFDYKDCILTLDPVLKEKTTSKPEKLTIKSYLLAGDSCIHLSKLKPSIYFYEAALNLSSKCKDIEYITKSMVGLAKTSFYLKDYNNSLTYFNKAYDLIKKSKNFTKTNIYINIKKSHIFSEKGDQDTAFNYINTALEECAKHKSKETDALIKKANVILSLIHFRKADLSKAEEIAKKNLNHLKNTDSLNIKIDTYRLLAIIDSIKGDYLSALYYYRKILPMCGIIKSKQPLIKCCLSLGLTYLNMGEFDIAEIEFDKTKTYLEDIDLKGEEVLLYSHFGHLYLSKENYKVAYRFYKKEFELVKKIENPLIKAYAFRNYGRILRLLNEPQNAEGYLKKSIEFFEQTADKVNTCLSKLELAKILVLLKNYSESEILINEVLVKFKNLKRYLYIAETYLVKSSLEFHSGLTIQSKNTLLQCIKNLKHINNCPRLVNIHNRIASLYEQLGEKDKALTYYSLVITGSKMFGMETIQKKALLKLDDSKSTSFELVLKQYKKKIDKFKERKSYEDEIIGESKTIKKIKELIETIANSQTNVLITGKSGTGKELVARKIYQKSDRKEKPFIDINCGAIPETLIESELFGFEKGAFTGATFSKPGKFESAQDGFVLLDEIGALPKMMQSKLLRVLQEREVTKLGSNKKIKLDIRVIAATNVNLEDMIKKDRFREDLYYRLNVFHLELPTLKERKEDIPILVSYFINKYDIIEKKSVKGISPEALDILMRYDWPGNIRELENCISRSIVVTTQKFISKNCLPPKLLNRSKIDIEPGIVKLEEIEKEHILKVLKLVEGNKNRAAKLLGLHRNTLYRKLLQYKLV